MLAKMHDPRAITFSFHFNGTKLLKCTLNAYSCVGVWGGGVQNSLNLCDVIYERPLRLLIERLYVSGKQFRSRKVFLCIEKNKDPFT